MRMVSVVVLFLSLAACTSETVESQAVEMWSGNEDCQGEFLPDPDPPRAGQTDYMVTLTDPDGAPIEGATLDIEPWMPAHGHGTRREPEVHDMGSGHYHAIIYYNMGGHWEITVEVETASMRDTFVFPQEVLE